MIKIYVNGKFYKETELELFKTGKDDIVSDLMKGGYQIQRIEIYKDGYSIIAIMQCIGCGDGFSI